MTTCFLFFLLVEIAADVSHGEFDVPEEEFSKTLVRKGKDNLSPYTSYWNRTIRTIVQLPLNYFRNSINIDVEGFRIEGSDSKKKVLVLIKLLLKAQLKKARLVSKIKK